MKLTYLLCILLTWSLAAFAQEATELQRLRNSYDGAVQRAVKPITETYLQQLKQLRDGYTRSTRLAEANQVEDEIKMVTTRLAALGGVTPAIAGHRAAVLDSRVTIAANTPTGYRLGPVRQGDIVTLQYLEGLWKGHGHLATVNPDDPQERDDESRLVIARGPTKDKPGDVIVLVPPDTAKKPFTYTFPTTRDDVVLRIHRNSHNPKNPGAVTYQVKIMR